MNGSAGPLEAGVPCSGRRVVASTWSRNAVIVGLASFTVAAWIGDLLLPVLVPERSHLLLLLNDRLRNFVLVSPHLDAASFYGIGFVRLIAPYPLYFLLGRWYGDASVRWMERRSPLLGSFLRRIERVFSGPAGPLIVLLPLNPVCVFAGAAGMRFRDFLLLKAVGTLTLLVSIRQMSQLIEYPLIELSDWIAANRLLVFVVCATAVGLSIWANWRRTGGSEIGHLANIDEEMAAIEAERSW